ncbi:hypothetical protein ABZW96_26545 [Nocardia sp. NPDC004168]|uniref:hypothetical protein n=1 Tax=Nocardia sp. NPDC004168 TaxID=3154452 RepID=UPI0033B764DD
MAKRTEQLCAGGHWPSPQEISDAATPDHRTILMVLLETQTWEQYSSVSSSMIDSGEYQASGRVSIHGRHPVTMTADRTHLRSIAVWSDWAATAHPDQIGDEILWCAEGIRAMRPKFTARGDYSRYSDADLENELDRHRLRLLNERMA